eukprot:5145765-Alexandrium_andersonii.AAC.1
MPCSVSSSRLRVGCLAACHCKPSRNTPGCTMILGYRSRLFDATAHSLELCELRVRAACDVARAELGRGPDHEEFTPTIPKLVVMVSTCARHP